MTIADAAPASVPSRVIGLLLGRATPIAILASIACLGCGSAPLAPPAPARPILASSAASLAPAPPPASASAASARPDPSSTATSPPVPASSPRRRARLRYDVGEHPFPAPLVDVVIGGHPTSMIVDTGASHHVVAEWLSREIALPVTKAGDRGIDHAGRSLTIARAENVSLSISGWGPVDAPILLVVAVPDALRRLGIGGVLAPQLLASAGRATLLDLRAGAMSDETESEAARRVEASEGSPAISGVRACGSATEGLMLLVAASIEGQPALLKLDSGAERSSLLQSSPAGKLLLGRAASKTTGYAASGSFTAPTLDGAKLKVGALETAVDINLVPGRPASSCPSDGFLGMDVLRSCTLSLQGDKTSGRCAAK